MRPFIIIPLALLMLGQGCFGGGNTTTSSPKPVTITWWRVFDDQDMVQPLIDAYRAVHPNVTIEYRKLTFAEYENTLLDALAEDRGPDIMSLHDTWISKYQSKLAPIPSSYQVPFTSIQGTIKKVQVTQLVTKQGMSIGQLQSAFVDVVANDVVRTELQAETPQQQPKQRIYALPLSGDNLALFYNKDLLNAAGIAQPPQYWDEFQADVKKLTKQDAQGNIVQSGAGIGTYRNVLRASDILSLLMMQNGTQMIDENGMAIFEKTPAGLGDRQVAPADEAVTFYTDFANPAKEVYTWNDKMPNSLEAFTQGRAAFFLGYAFNLPDIRSAAPKLNFGIAKVPQINGNPETNYANYWVEAVSKKSANQQWAWDFLQFATAAQQDQSYLNAARHPTALRSLIQGQLQDIDLSVFASQMLTAKSWYRGKNEAAAEAALGALITNVLAGAPVHQAVNNAVNAVNQTYQ